MHYLLIYDVADDYLERRAAHRDAHLDLARAAADRGELILGGAVDAGRGGAMLLFKGDSPADAIAFAKADPYVKHKVVTKWTVSEWTTVVGDLAEAPVAPPAREIRFYSTRDAYGEFSNFHPSPFTLNGKKWPTVEHYFQAQKFTGTPSEEEIRQAARPSLAAKMGRSRKRPLRRDWESVKDNVMRTALRAKFEQNEVHRNLLMSTSPAKLIEHTENDAYWGDGGDGSGKNRLGQLLVELREALLSEGK